MTSTLPHAHHAFVLLDPVQDYEETITILGVYGSLDAAKTATSAHRRRPYAKGGVYEYSPSRVTHIEHRAGDQVLARWEYDPESGWRQIEVTP